MAKKKNNPNKKLLKLAASFKPWDFAYMLDLEKQALIQMQKYHEESNLIEDNPKIAKQIKLAISLLNIADGTDSAWKHSGSHCEHNFTQWVDRHINTKNSKRFINHNIKNFNTPIFLDDFRKIKAWHLYNKLRSRYMFTWWD